VATCDFGVWSRRAGIAAFLFQPPESNTFCVLKIQSADKHVIATIPPAPLSPPLGFAQKRRVGFSPPRDMGLVG
jgi:hypothetical protein